MKSEPEFSRPFAVDRLGAAAVIEVVSASQAECEALARRFGIVALGRLSASLRIERVPGGLIRISGRLEADVTQNCVVSLADFGSHVQESFAVDFGNSDARVEAEIDVDPDYDPPEPIEDGVIDLGELVAQYLSLALDPHPRAPGALLDADRSEPDAPNRSPFAILEKLKNPN